MNIRIVGLIFSFIFISDGLNAQEIIQKNSITKKPVEYEYFFDSIAVRKNQNNQDLGVEEIGKYLFEYKADKLNFIINQLSEQERYIVVRGADQRIKFFNGSIMIKFNELPNFESFALENNLIFVSSLAQIGIGVFRVRNINNIEIKIEDLRAKSNVLNIELDLLDPSIGPN